MKQKTLVTLILLLGMIASSVRGQQVRIPDSLLTQSTAGGTAASGNYKLFATVGQVSPPDIASSSQFTLYSGFIYSLGLSKFDTAKADFSLAYGSSEKNYRIISVPAVLNKPDPEAVLVDDLGGYNKKEWRLFDCTDGKNANTEFPDTRDLTPGVGLYLIVKSPGKTFDIEDGAWLETISYTIKLQKGWNLIGNPYNLTIDASKLTLTSADKNDVLKIWDYSGGWTQASQILPWHGYAISVLGDASLTYEPYRKTSANLARAENNVASADQWCIQIAAQNEASRDVWNFAGVAATAKLDRDIFDDFEPPVLGDYISLYFPHPEWQTFLTNLSSDYRAPADAGHTWNFEIRSNLTAPVTLNFSGLDGVPANYEIWLVDAASDISQNLRSNPNYPVAVPAEEQPRLLKLIVGNQQFIQQQVGQFQLIPEHYELAQNFPNPFNPCTTIRYGLPVESRVTLKIFNLLGEEVVTLMNDQSQKAGYHIHIWDGRNQQGHPVANGMYVYQLRAGDVMISKKMALMK